MKPFSRGAGILLPITSLPSSYGIGTLGSAAFQFVDLLVDLRQRYWQVLPLGPTGVGDSPYQSLSAFAGNPYLIDLDDLINQGLLSLEEIQSYNWGKDDSKIDYSKLYENRFSVLKQAYQRFNSDTQEYIKFCSKQEYWLEDYSLFMDLKTFSENQAWVEWHSDFRDKNSDSCKEYKQEHVESINFWKFCQYQFFKQWLSLKQYANNRGIQIIGDIPFYVSQDSVDVWAHRMLFQVLPQGQLENVAGSPPDSFSLEGQIWGNPLYNWREMEKNQFEWWEKRIRQSAQMYDAIRMDHFTGIVRYYSIPVGDTSGKKGKWNKGPGKRLTDRIENALGECRFIVDDLGTSIAGVKKLLQKSQWSNMKVLLFAFDGNTANEYLPHNYTDTNTVVYAGTHDNETIVGYFRDKTEYEIAFLYEYLGIEQKEDIPDAFIRLAYSSIADVVIIQMQDLLKLGNETRMNRPSTVGTNWKWRLGNEVLSDDRRIWLRTLSTLYRR